MTENLDPDDIKFYMKDALCLLLNYRRNNPSVHVNNFFAEYFRTVKNGTHVLCRSLEFIKSSEYNKKAFMKLWWKHFSPICRFQEKISSEEICSLTKLICFDFPYSVIQSAYILTDSKTTFAEDDLTFVDFAFQFQFCFLYDKFCEELNEEFRRGFLAKEILKSGYQNAVQNAAALSSDANQQYLSSMDWLRLLNKIGSAENARHAQIVGHLKQLVTNYERLSIPEVLKIAAHLDCVISDISIVTTVTDIASSEVVTVVKAEPSPETRHHSSGHRGLVLPQEKTVVTNAPGKARRPVVPGIKSSVAPRTNKRPLPSLRMSRTMGRREAESSDISEESSDDEDASLSYNSSCSSRDSMSP